MARSSFVAAALSAGLIDDAPCGFLSAGPNGKIIYANLTLARWLGYETGLPADGFTFLDVFAKSSGLYFDAQILPMIQLQGFAREISCHLAGQDGKPGRPVLMNVKFRPSAGTIPERMDFVFFDATERLRFETTLQEARSEAEELAAIVKNATVGIVRVDHEGRLKRWNAAAEAIFRRKGAAPEGKSITEVVALDNTANTWFQDAKEEITRKGEHQFEAQIDAEIHLNISVGEIVNRVDPFAASDYSIILRDVTRQVLDRTRLDLMVQELNHRVKNTLAVVSGLIRQSLRRPEVREERQKLIERLQSVAASHDILTSNYWQNAEMAELIKPLQAQLDDPGRITFDGPKVMLNPNHFKSLSMAFHELMTNALKYGAFSDDHGRVSIRWSQDGPENTRLSLTWTETGGPATTPPDRSGFGSIMIEKLLTAEFKGETKMDFRPEGLKFSFRGQM
ncbi:sensor histidine kinase [Puniceibacterium confluentis]|uniref:sensor histidine kinase n=1 Tax=Puniceibacterium confluentis TaxID=1958944 RepID=UPI003563C7C5